MIANQMIKTITVARPSNMLYNHNQKWFSTLLKSVYFWFIVHLAILTQLLPVVATKQSIGDTTLGVGRCVMFMVHVIVLVRV